jgi:hypothetical protein
MHTRPVEQDYSRVSPQGPINIWCWYRSLYFFRSVRLEPAQRFVNIQDWCSDCRMQISFFWSMRVTVTDFNSRNIRPTLGQRISVKFREKLSTIVGQGQGLPNLINLCESIPFSHPTILPGVILLSYMIYLHFFLVYSDSRPISYVVAVSLFLERTSEIGLHKIVHLVINFFSSFTEYLILIRTSSSFRIILSLFFFTNESPANDMFCVAVGQLFGYLLLPSLICLFI